MTSSERKRKEKKQGKRKKQRRRKEKKKGKRKKEKKSREKRKRKRKKGKRERRKHEEEKKKEEIRMKKEERKKRKSAVYTFNGLIVQPPLRVQVCPSASAVNSYRALLGLARASLAMSAILFTM